MERKIGEIFEYNGEWYQCFVGNYCKSCAFNERKCYSIVENGDPIGECCADRRKDNKDVFFKKLEKVGEPYTYYCPSGRIIYFQRYKIFNKSYSNNTEYIMCDFNEDDIISIELKQTKENMEEKKLNLKPFDIQKAREGKPVCTRDGRKARIICFDLKGAEYPIVAAVETHDCLAESISAYDKNGKFDHDKENNNDLMMLPEKKEGWMNIYTNTAVKNSRYCGSNIYASKEEALNNISPFLGHYINTNKIEWEE